VKLPAFDPQASETFLDDLLLFERVYRNSSKLSFRASSHACPVFNTGLGETRNLVLYQSIALLDAPDQSPGQAPQVQHDSKRLNALVYCDTAFQGREMSGILRLSWKEGLPSSFLCAFYLTGPGNRL
jgi:hypothetical protein